MAETALNDLCRAAVAYAEAGKMAGDIDTAQIEILEARQELLGRALILAAVRQALKANGIPEQS